MNDLISRQAAIDALNGEINITGRANAEAVRGYVRLVKDRLERLPSAQPKERTEERAETHACDLIDRQAAIDALDERFDKIPMEKTTEILKLRKDLRELPSIQSEQISNCKSTLEDIYRAGYANGLDDIQMEFSTDFAVNILSQLEYILKWKIKDGLLASSDVADGLRIALREIDRLKGYIEAGDGEK